MQLVDASILVHEVASALILEDASKLLTLEIATQSPATLAIKAWSFFKGRRQASALWSQVGGTEHQWSGDVKKP